jgi:5-methylcytosine-specific restriction endonuclease McrA
MTRRYRDREELRRLYVEEQPPVAEIADEVDVSAATISHWLTRTGITEEGAMETTACEECGGQLRHYPSLRSGRFCSNGCGSSLRDGHEVKTCPGCGSDFKREPSMDTEYCSLDCWAAETHPTEGTSKYRNWYAEGWERSRNAALRRDGHECVVCGMTDDDHREQTGRGLEVHHRVPVRLFVRWDRPVEDAHALRNLMTVCRTHHPDAPGTVDNLSSG